MPLFTYLLNAFSGDLVPSWNNKKKNGAAFASAVFQFHRSVLRYRNHYHNFDSTSTSSSSGRAPVRKRSRGAQSRCCSWYY